MAATQTGEAGSGEYASGREALLAGSRSAMV
jgi:hypothetical protein